jgi:hypothetical protein
LNGASIEIGDDKLCSGDVGSDVGDNAVANGYLDGEIAVCSDGDLSTDIVR